VHYAETFFFKDSTAIQKWDNIFYAETAFFELGTEVCGRDNHLSKSFRPLEVYHYTVLFGVLKPPGFSKRSKVAVVRHGMAAWQIRNLRVHISPFS
jgi:hypothetical protein